MSRPRRPHAHWSTRTAATGREQIVMRWVVGPHRTGHAPRARIE